MGDEFYGCNQTLHPFFEGPIPIKIGTSKARDLKKVAKKSPDGGRDQQS